MPKQKRWYVKRKLDQAVNLLFNAQQHLIVTAQDYKDVHPEIYDNMSEIVTAIEFVKDSIRKLRDSI